MGSYSKFTIEKVRSAADIRYHIPDADVTKRTSYCRCPECGETGKNKGLCVTHNSKMDIAKCFKCGFTINGAINAEMYYRGVGFVEALETVARQSGVIIETEQEEYNNKVKSFKNKSKDSFCERQLTASGLTISDVMATVLAEDGKTSIQVPTFQKGGIDTRTNQINYNDDEMLILYYDLYGNPMKYATRGVAGGLKNYVRVRWSNPAIHLSLEGKEIKYQSPKGAGARFYFPQIIRNYYAEGKEIETLIIQEGEKKAEKACKHGILSIAIQGIYNIGSKESGLIKDLQYLVQKCNIKNIVLLFDSDWNSISANIVDGDSIDRRPNQFAKAAVKFKKYVETMRITGISVDIFIGHINGEEKGIDDLLTVTLRNREDVLKTDIQNAMLAHDGKGEHVDIHKVSTLTDFQIMDFWKLRDRDAFFKEHQKEIEHLTKFKFGKIIYKKDGDVFVQSANEDAVTDFWGISYNEKTGKKIPEFDTLQAKIFLEANGFCRVSAKNLPPGEFYFVNVENGIVRRIGDSNIRDFAYDYALQNCRDRDVLVMITEKLGSLLGKDKLERLKRISNDFDHPEPYKQIRYFRNGMLTITSNSIEFGQMMGMTWESNITKRIFKRIPVIKHIKKNEYGEFEIELTKEGLECEFFRFLENTSNFWKYKGNNLSGDEINKWIRHVVNKITCLGYLLADYKYDSEQKAIVAMDAKMSEVGDSNGRSGKSMIAIAIKNTVNQIMIDGKNLKNDDDYMFSEVNYETKNITIDDVNVNFDFQKIFQAITGDMNVNPKMAPRFTIPKEDSPKFYITTNHAIKDSSNSAKARITFMSFSNYYNIDYTPIMDFGHAFFSEWDEYQWALFDNLMAECVMYYLKTLTEEWEKKGNGTISPPMEDLKAREYRQEMGEAFFQWACAYFDENSGNLNTRLNRKILYDKFVSDYPGQKAFVTTSNFRKKIIAYAKFAKLAFNPHKRDEKQRSYKMWVTNPEGDAFIGDRDTSGGIDYFTLSNHDKAIQNSL